jgi:hypothetical protein
MSNEIKLRGPVTCYVCQLKVYSATIKCSVPECPIIVPPVPSEQEMGGAPKRIVGNYIARIDAKVDHAMNLKILEADIAAALQSGDNRGLREILLKHRHGRFNSNFRSECSCGWNTPVIPEDEGYVKWIEHFVESALNEKEQAK